MSEVTLPLKPKRTETTHGLNDELPMTFRQGERIIALLELLVQAPVTSSLKDLKHGLLQTRGVID